VCDCNLVGAIVGGIIGSIILILAIILLLWRKKRRAQKREERNSINPFMIDNSATNTPSVNASTLLDNKAIFIESLVLELENLEPTYNEETVLMDDDDRPAVGLATRTRMVRREEDVGSIHGISEFDGEIEETLPPDYNDLVERRQS